MPFLISPLLAEGLPFSSLQPAIQVESSLPPLHLVRYKLQVLPGATGTLHRSDNAIGLLNAYEYMMSGTYSAGDMIVAKK